MKSVIIGAGTYGEVYLAYLQEAGIEIVGFLDDNPRYINQKVCGIPVLGELDFLACLKDKYDVEAVYCPLGNNKLRVEILKRALSLGPWCVPAMPPPYSVPKDGQQKRLIGPYRPTSWTTFLI